MIRIILLLALVAPFFGTRPVCASEVNGLAACTVKIFQEINRTGKWSGKPPAGCPSTVAVEKRPDGAYVTVWKVENVTGGWVNTAFSTAEGYWEIAGKKDLAKANRDIISRARRLSRCLDSIVAKNDPLECRQKGVKSYNVGEETGIEMQKTIWLPDNGRYAAVEFSYGDSETEPEEPADFIETSPLPPGMAVIIEPRIGGGKDHKSSTGKTGSANTGAP